MSSSSSSYATVLQAFDGVISFALCPHVVFKLLSTSDLLRQKPLVMASLPASISAEFACQYICYVISLYPGMSINSLTKVLKKESETRMTASVLKHDPNT